VAHRRTEADVLPYRFLKTAKRNLFSFCMADSMGKRMTFGQALAAGLLFSKWIEKNRPEDKMMGLLLPSTTGGALANLGVSLSGKVPVNLNFTSGKEAMDYALAQCGIKTILTSKVFLHKAGLEPMEGMVYLEDLLREFSPLQKALAALEAFLTPSWLIRKTRGFKNQKPEDLATVIFSSGSTGTPKGVMLSHYNILSNLEACEQLFWVVKKDRIMGVLPFFHSFGFMGTLWFPLVAGFGAVYHPNPVDAKTIGDLVFKYKATILISTPTFYSAYIRKCPAEQFATLRFAVVGAEKLRATIASEYKEKYGRDLMEGYGCTEMSPVVAVNIPDFENSVSKQKGMKPGTVGQPVPGVAVRIIHAETGEPLPPGEEGLILVKGSNRMMGYLGAPEKMAEVVKDGWYVTGDIGMLDEEGFLHITDRLSRFSKIGGEMVPHLKVEEALHPILGDYVCAVTSIPDEQKGEKLVVLHTHPQLTPENFWSHLSNTELPKLWVPKKDHYYFVENLPSLGSGKLDLKGVKQKALELLTFKG
jgi:acyl-[acyl-carrier-protein]-phospholipid O-acyltransferase/long-chain-fatty-acid--[acyl-carrier-protein] ligase